MLRRYNKNFFYYPFWNVVLLQLILKLQKLLLQFNYFYILEYITNNIINIL